MRQAPRGTLVNRLIVRSFAVSLDGYSAGPAQDMHNPLGIGGLALMEWFFHTQVWCRMHGQPPPAQGSPVDERFAQQGFQHVGAWILGRNMFGPVRGAWPDEAWRGWWGEEPPYHTPVFVLTHHARPSLRMAGGTEFHFVTEGIHAALEKARAAAGDLDIRLGGGVATVREYLRAGLIAELHLAVRPVLLGRGEALFQDLDLRALGYECAQSVSGERALHVTLRRELST
jgi:dihydrofolate reductase